MWETISRLKLEARLPEIACPTLVIAGGHDGDAPPALAAERIARGVRGVRVETMPGLGHFPPIEDADAFNRILGRFLAEAEAAS